MRRCRGIAAEKEEMWHDQPNAGPVARAPSAALNGAAPRVPSIRE